MSDRKTPFGTSDYPEPEPNAYTAAERDRAFNLGIETAAAWLDQQKEQCASKEFRQAFRWSATAVRTLKRKVD